MVPSADNAPTGRAAVVGHQHQTAAEVMGLRAILLALWLPLSGALVASPAVRPRAVLRRPLAVYAHGGAAAIHSHDGDGTDGGDGGLLEGWMRLKSQHDDLWQAFRRHAKTPSRRALARDYAEGAQITLIGAELESNPSPDPKPTPNLTWPQPQPQPQPEP